MVPDKTATLKRPRYQFTRRIAEIFAHDDRTVLKEVA
jgi:hypothetical protein